MPGQHPSDLTDRVDFERLEGTVAGLDSGVERGGVLTRELQGKVVALQQQVAALQALKGRLIDVQALKGNGAGGLVAITSGVTIPVRISGANVPMEFNYTPAVDVWWEVVANIGYVEAQTGAYVDAFGQLTISPNDLIAAGDTESSVPTIYQCVTQHSTVDTRVLRCMSATWKLQAGVAYQARAYVTFTAGNAFRVAVGYNAMFGKAWTR